VAVPEESSRESVRQARVAYRMKKRTKNGDDLLIKNRKRTPNRITPARTWQVMSEAMAFA
jgi:hypothetical protein